MRLHTVACIIACLSVGASAAPTSSTDTWVADVRIPTARWCHAKNPVNITVEADMAPKIAAVRALRKSGLAKREDGVRIVNVFWHMITKGPSVIEGTLPYGVVQNQIDILNDGYKGRGYLFTLAGLVNTNNALWFDSAFGKGFSSGGNNDASDGSVQKAMKEALHFGGRSDLNLYSVGFNDAPGTGELGMLGYSTFPMNYDLNPTDDGVVFGVRTIPGGPKGNVGTGSGKTLVHEVGHWLALFHPFQGEGDSDDGCVGPGDFIDDTPAEASAAPGGCHVDRDSCPNLPGLDAVHNYMDYSDDSCLTEFTDGQQDRMHAFWTQYRDPGISSITIT